MSPPRPSLGTAYFDAIYARDPDPWKFRTSAYETEKYGSTLGSLRRSRYKSALEVGCSIGVFTRRLAERCDALLGIDASDHALAQARDTCRDMPQVQFRRAAVPGGFPCEPFDLIVLSEVLYYLSAADLVRVADLCTTWLSPQGEIVLCHWLGQTDYPLSGEDAATLFLERTLTRLPIRRELRREAYRLDHLSEAEPRGGVAGR